MKYPEYKSVNYANVAEEIRKQWQQNDTFKKSVSFREGNPAFTFYEGPPSANGQPGIHHVMARTIKDIFCRYQTLKGFQVKRKGGWDTHGLPVELQVEKEISAELGEKFTKEDIGTKISVDEYNRRCREAVMRFTDIWEDMTERMGYWVDMDDPYITYKNEYIESIWYLLKKLYEKGLLYKGYTIQPYSPAAGTGLSSHELNMPGTYKDVRDTSMTAQFKVIENDKSSFLFDVTEGEVFILAWTTTPWTLPSNAALTIGKNIEYSLIKTYNPYTYLPINVILATDLVGNYFAEKGKDGDFDGYLDSDKKILPWSLIAKFKGESLEGIEYEQLLPYVQPDAPAFRVIIGDFVTTEDGTGVVHTAPTFGADDFRVAQQNGIPAIMVKDENGKEMPLVDKQGRFVKEVTDFPLEYVKAQYYTEEELESERMKQGRDVYLSVDERLSIKLKEENRAFNVQRYEHSYPHCWRTDKPVLYYPLDSWFIRTTAVKDKLVELNKTINWKPESTGTGRFGNWLENLVDWNLSRSRYWGTPLPIWRNEDGEEICIGSVEELSNEIDKAIAAGLMTENYLKPHPKSLSGGEGLDSSQTFLQEHVFKADKAKWELLKETSRNLRKESTDAEKLVWERVRNNQLGYKFRRQHVIDGYITDFTCVSARVVFEIDGSIHENQQELDQLRTDVLGDYGYKVFRFSNHEVFQDLDNVINQMKEILEVETEKRERTEKRIPSPPERGQGVRLDYEAFDLHRPYVDDVVLVSPTGKPLYREPDLIDVWFDSGAMPYAQWHYPFENQETFNKAFPADFISEGVDQTRGWFFTLHAIAGMLFDSVAFKNVLSTGLVLDKDGNKMSKRLGNAIDPFTTLADYGADPTRWYMVTNAQPWDNLRFDLAGITEVRNKFFGTLTNTYNFFALYANLDNYEINEFNRLSKENLTELDRWILSKLMSLVKDVDGYYADYEPTKAGRAIQEFVSDHLSNWYVRLSRKRFWNTAADPTLNPSPEGRETSPLSLGEESGARSDKQAAYETLQHCLLAVAQLMSPIAPFYGDWLYQNMTRSYRESHPDLASPLAAESVHLTDFHPYDETWVDADLENSMELAQRISSMVHALRKANKIKVRQPLSKILIPVLNEQTREAIRRVDGLIKSEVNIKSIEYLDDASGVLSKKVKPNFKTLGPKFGKDMKNVVNAINGMTAEQLNQLEADGEISLNDYSIELSDVEILTEDLPGYLTAQEGGLTVALDITITEELRKEGIAREFVNRIQNLRKDSGFEVTDKINVLVKDTDPTISEAIRENRAYIMQEVQALTLDILAEVAATAELDIDGVTVTVSVTKN